MDTDRRAPRSGVRWLWTLLPGGAAALVGLYAGIMAPPLSAEHAARGGEEAARHRFTEAIEEYDRAIALDAKNAAAFTGRGMARVLRGGDYPRAIEDFNAAIALGDRPGEAYIGRGLAKAGRGLYREAIDDLTRGVELEPTHALGHFGRGLALTRIGSWEEGEKALREALRRSERDAIVLALGLVVGLRGEASESKRLLERAEELSTLQISLHPSSPRSLLLRAQARMGLGQLGEAASWQGAKEDLARAAEADPACEEITLAHAELALLEGKDSEAIAWCDRSIAREDASRRAWSLRAFALARQGAVDRAEADARRVLEENDRDALALFARGCALEARGEPSQAASDFDAALRTSPPKWPFRPVLQERLGRLRAGR